jgi:Na+/H+ antiporter NhaC
MFKAENRARRGKVLGDEAVPITDFDSMALKPAKDVVLRWYNGLVPILVVIVATFCGLYVSGKGQLLKEGKPLAGGVVKKLGTIVSAADSFQVLLWASLLGLSTAFLLTAIQRILQLRIIVSAMVQGIKSMMMAIIILVLAWSLGVVLVELQTAEFLVSLLATNLDYHFLPALVFIFSAFIAFSTGSSWGTIGIMYPLVIPLAIALLKGSGDFQYFLVLTIASILAGAVFGDHCSPISDTTIMSSLASSCDHIDHVRTQLPYALTVALIALFVGILPVSIGFPYLFSLFICAGILLMVIWFFGKRPA